LGATPVADALASVADDFAYFSIDEARAVRRPGIALGPALGEPAEYRELDLRPAVSSRAQLERFRDLRPLLNVDTGMQRFGCSAETVEDILTHDRVDEAFTHADTPRAAALLRELCGGRVPVIHAAASGLLGVPEAWLDAVRPGLALYRGAVRVTATLATVREVSAESGTAGSRCRGWASFWQATATGCGPRRCRSTGAGNAFSKPG